MSFGKLTPTFPPIPPISNGTPPTSASWSGDAMDTLKMKIGLLMKDSSESSMKIEAAEKAKSEADDRTAASEQKIRELSKIIHARKIQLDEKNDQCQKNISSARKKEEATIAAREEISKLTLKEMALKSEVERVSAALPDTSDKLCKASEHADKELGEVKKLEIRAMLADQTIEEMEQQLKLAQSMSNSTNHKVDEMLRKIDVRESELKRAEEQAMNVQLKLEGVQDKLRVADRKMAGLQYALEDKSGREHKLKRQIQLLQARLQEAKNREGREVDALNKMKQNINIRIAQASKTK